VATLIRCKGPIAELDANLAVELALAGVLPAPVTVAMPERVICMGAQRCFRAGPGTLRCAGSLEYRDPSGAIGPLHEAPSHLAITDTLALALVDNNPLAGLEAHPDKQGSALDLGGQPTARWRASLREALAIVGRLPALRAEIDVGLQLVVPVGYDESQHLSASYQEAIGAVYLSLHPNPMTMAEALIHEFSHNKLHALLEQGPLLENAWEPLYPSPLRPDPRPLHGVLLAVHAFLPVARLYEQLLAGGDAEGLRGRYLQIVASNHEAAQTLRQHARPTALGRPLLAEIDRWDRHFAGG
jgi:HEXXH motif-containing protein